MTKKEIELRRRDAELAYEISQALNEKKAIFVETRTGNVISEKERENIFKPIITPLKDILGTSKLNLKQGETLASTIVDTNKLSLKQGENLASIITDSNKLSLKQGEDLAKMIEDNNKANNATNILGIESNIPGSIQSKTPYEIDVKTNEWLKKFVVDPIAFKNNKLTVYKKGEEEPYKIPGGRLLKDIDLTEGQRILIAVTSKIILEKNLIEQITDEDIEFVKDIVTKLYATSVSPSPKYQLYYKGKNLFKEKYEAEQLAAAQKAAEIEAQEIAAAEIAAAKEASKKASQEAKATREAAKEAKRKEREATKAAKETAKAERKAEREAAELAAANAAVETPPGGTPPGETTTPGETPTTITPTDETVITDEGISGNGIKNKLFNIQTGQFGKVYIDLPLLQKLQLKVKNKKRVIILQRVVDKSFIDLLTKRFFSNKKYSPESINVYNELIKISEVEIPKHLTKNKIVGTSSVVLTSPDQLLDKLENIVGSIRAGNNSIENKNMGTSILDQLIINQLIDKSQHKMLYKKYFQL